MVGLDDELKGMVPFGFVVLNNECKDDHKVVVQECVSLVRDIVGPVASFKHGMNEPAERRCASELFSTNFSPLGLNYRLHRLVSHCR